MNLWSEDAPLTPALSPKGEREESICVYNPLLLRRRRVPEKRDCTLRVQHLRLWTA